MGFLAFCLYRSLSTNVSKSEYKRIEKKCTNVLTVAISSCKIRKQTYRMKEYKSYQKRRKKRTVQTTKKQKFVGYKTLVDPETGESYPMQINVLEERDFNFHKVWLQHLVNSLDGISNQRLRLAFWIIDHLDKENKLTLTQRAIAEKSGMSLNTVTKTMKALQEGTPAFLVKINSGAYRVNPEIIWKGSYGNRMGICYEYYSEQQGEQFE